MDKRARMHKALDVVLAKDAKAIRWRVQPAPTGLYKSFDVRGWPDADYSDGSPAVHLISNGDAFESHYNSRNKEITELIVRLADHSVKPWKWRQLTARPRGLTAAKTVAEQFLSQHPEYAPK